MRSFWVLMAVGVSVAACASTGPPPAADVMAVLDRTGPVEPVTADWLRAYEPEEYLTGLAGHGVGGDLDLSAACGCAETGSSGPSSGSGPSAGPGVEHRADARVRVIIKVPEVSDR